MNIQYNKQDDVLMIELNNKSIDYAEQSGDIIVHFSSEREAVLLEFLDATEFFKKASAAFPSKIRQQVITS